jgi:hypothetical protein
MRALKPMKDAEPAPGQISIEWLDRYTDGWRAAAGFDD